MFVAAILSVSLLDFSSGFTESERYDRYRKYLLNKIPADCSTTILKRTCVLTSECVGWIESEFPKKSVSSQRKLIRVCIILDCEMPISIDRYVIHFGDAVSSNELSAEARADLVLQYFFKHGREIHAAYIAKYLFMDFGNFTNIFYSVISILHDIGTSQEITLIDKAKENGLLATDGDFWKKAAEAKKAILSRAEAKKNAELKAKPLDK